jgi:hypothetical protein
VTNQLTPRKLHASMRRQAVIIKAIIPVGVGHKHFTLSGKLTDGLKADSPLRCAYLMAMLEGVLLAVPLMLTIFPTRLGKSHPAARLCIPPIEDPTLAYNFVIPNLSKRTNCARTMSNIDTTGKLVPHGFPVSASIEDGPVEP